MEGLVEEEDNEAAEAANEEEHAAVGAITLSEKKTERQRKKEKAEKLKVHTFALAIWTIAHLFMRGKKNLIFRGYKSFSTTNEFCMIAKETNI